MSNEIHENLIEIIKYSTKGKLPDPFLFDDGSRVATADDWSRRRKEMYKTVIELQYGTMPPKPEFVTVEPMYLGGAGMREYIGREDELPFDSHHLKAMVAPRVLFVSEAASDIMANPVGTWQTSLAAKEVYKFLGCEENLIWYFRRGGHYHEIEDIEQLVNVIRHVKYGEPLNDKYFKIPFKPMPLEFDWRAPEN